MTKSGFTLIELLIAVSIIAILSMIGLVSFQGIQGRARDSIRKDDLNTIATALELYNQTYGKYLINSGSCIGGGAGDALYTDTNFKKFISGDIPKDPKTGANYCYESEDGFAYKLYAKLEDGSDYILTSEDYIAQAQSQNPANPPAPGNNNPPSGDNPPPATPTPPSLRVFVTRSSYTGNLGGLSGADLKCQTAANSNSSLRNSLWRAWISTGQINAKERISDGKYILISGTVIADNKADLLDGSIAAPINLTEDNSTPSIYNGESFPYVWTGTDLSGNKTANTCAGWDRPETANGTLGVVGAGRNWTAGGDGIDQCQTYLRHLYCFEQPQASSTGGAGCLTAYRDFDNDGYTISTPVYFCNTTTLPYGYKSSPSASADCYDQNPNAHPGQTQYFTTDRGDGSFDYDCSGSIQPLYPYLGASCGTYSLSCGRSCTNSGLACIGIDRATTAADCGILAGYVTENPELIPDEGTVPSLWLDHKEKLSCR